MTHKLKRLQVAADNIPAKLAKPCHGHLFIDRHGRKTFLEHLHCEVAIGPSHAVTRVAFIKCVQRYFDFSRGQLERLLTDVNPASFKERPYVAYYGLLRIIRQARRNKLEMKKRQAKKAA
ncbi:MAG: hypothetical protein A3F35_00335 [Candidatus Woykebacteria bacterium RIFCSPHIGHO2_12_FULL_45_10]|uniref:Uncharacterized protein n=1 Tax=Candidatus Woykebacteria bacterium RIFCSPHIGHO2_12_FULL_45_10 TaxID=1802603 RepID=A0A1G1WRS5_9BACT|nr:MAG: hypothetical protein A3F35_00335 [Candidatus Woykebacteria bacterium RIFCSPHIGHO2_12_FULL_45_10]